MKWWTILFYDSLVVRPQFCQLPCCNLFTHHVYLLEPAPLLRFRTRRRASSQMSATTSPTKPLSAVVREIDEGAFCKNKQSTTCQVIFYCHVSLPRQHAKQPKFIQNRPNWGKTTIRGWFRRYLGFEGWNHTNFLFRGILLQSHTFEGEIYT